MGLPPFLAGIIGWLRAGYPNGVPATDYVALLALLSRRLTDDEVRRVADELVESGDLPVQKADIEQTITALTHGVPSETDVNRVADRLRAGGWHNADPLLRQEST